jgi:hypothetical protein
MPVSAKAKAVYMLARYRERRREAVRRLGGRCVVCGTRKNLEIDHKNSDAKSMTVGRMTMVTQKRFDAELKKCQLLCQKHHIEKTTRERGLKPARGTHGTLSSYRYCHCEECKEAKRMYATKKRAARTRRTGR